MTWIKNNFSKEQCQRTVPEPTEAGGMGDQERNYHKINMTLQNMSSESTIDSSRLYSIVVELVQMKVPVLLLSTTNCSVFE